VRHLHAAIDAVRPAAVISSDPGLGPAVPAGTALLTIDDLRRHGSAAWSSLRRPEPDQVHHIQLTSGSTSAPKAAVLTHANVASNIHGMRTAMDLRPFRDRTFSWLPLYHDMGLVFLLVGLSTGAAVDLMPPTGFVRDPMSWLRHMSSRGAAVTGAPPFAYRAAVDRFLARGESELDLSALRQAYIGAEPIPVSILQQFQDTFADHGLAEDALVPSYGMAETVVGTTVAVHKHATTETSFGCVRWHDFDRAALDEHRLARPAQPGQPARRIVSCGTPLPGLSLRITRPDGGEAADGEVGEIDVSGTSVMAGYLTPDGLAPAGGRHDTGDLGLFLDGELYVVGRTKEMLIVRGRNLPPYDIENVVEEHPLVNSDGCAVFSYHADTTATEHVVAVIETRAKPEQWQQIHTDIATTVRQTFGLSLADVVFLPRGGIPRTTSGKRRRQALRDAYLAGRLNR
jgi:fatty-acyl-CoA synthase